MAEDATVEVDETIDNDPTDNDDNVDGAKVDHSDRPNWESESRKHERRAKQEAKKREQLEAELAQYREQNQTETEKLLAKARDEARQEVLREAQQERRNDRLEVSVTRLASLGLTVGDGDDARKVKFADPDDALVHIQRAISAGDVDPDDIFDSEGKVQTDALTTALADLLERKPHLQAGDGNPAPRITGSADGGRGSGPGKELEDMSPEDHAKRKYGR